ncbi:hypothetical protein [Bartonella mastomydis]|uniref:hypothetical protein n=1 Tax=Bartonella mastomydis TaxID=1820002 RepID=UPI00111757F8|nr:hypothetical protein [Bartonella mastomydis]
MIKTVQEKTKNDSYEEFQGSRAFATLGAGKACGEVMIVVLSCSKRKEVGTQDFAYTISRVLSQNGCNER